MVLYTTILLIIQGESFWLRLQINLRADYLNSPLQGQDDYSSVTI